MITMLNPLVARRCPSGRSHPAEHPCISRRGHCRSSSAASCATRAPFRWVAWWTFGLRPQGGQGKLNIRD